jgi:hypothetical protein
VASGSNATKSNATFQVVARLFVQGTERNSLLSGTTRVVVNHGKAVFDDLVIGKGDTCGESCTVTLRFELDGALCTETWCTNVTLTVSDGVITPPHKLGMHPGFPSTPAVEGVVVLANVAATSDWDAATDAPVASLLSCLVCPVLAYQTLPSSFLCTLAHKYVNAQCACIQTCYVHRVLYKSSRVH